MRSLIGSRPGRLVSTYYLVIAPTLPRYCLDIARLVES
ncbi:hypothetical protein BH11PSE11_BH11PSE11_33010 [soil metagenome]